MATVILGGLVTSTLLNVLVLPTLALRYGRFEPRQALSQTEQYRDFRVSPDSVGVWKLLSNRVPRGN
jgi:hypothetical protein